MTSKDDETVNPWRRARQISVSVRGTVRISVSDIKRIRQCSECETFRGAYVKASYPSWTLELR
jgi:hypothetical protein